MELQKGRPKYTAGRLEKEIRTYDLLDKLGVAYERVDHEAAMTMEVKRISRHQPVSPQIKKFRRIIKVSCFFYIICHRSIDFIHGIEWDNL